MSAPFAIRNTYFVFFIALSLLAFWRPMEALAKFAFEYEYASHIILIPLVSTFLMYRERKRIFLNLGHSFVAGTSLSSAGVGLYAFTHWRVLELNPNDDLSVKIFAAVVVWVGGFILCYGTQAFRAAAFPLLFLLLMVPLPTFFLEESILLLQKGSAEITHALFNAIGIPVFREGLVFSLTGVTIEIAKECSGIRSSLALFITCLLAAHQFLRSRWRKTLFALSAFPVAIVKNGLRIVSLSLLGTYVDQSFLAGSLHRDGGILFFLLGLVILVPVLRLLQRSEDNAPE